ncbi:MAG: ECF-type sigma factor [Acidobacteriota bacterium]|nr:ECF-type sigma factor [Acidobacteriota bacterium]
MRRERPGHTLQTTALINEAYLRPIDAKNVNWQSRAHFFAIAANLMRRVLVEHARRRDRVGPARDSNLHGNLRALWRKCQFPNPGVSDIRRSAFGEVLEFASADLACPDIKRPIPVGDKGHELPVSRDHCVPLRFGEVRERRELCVGERITP